MWPVLIRSVLIIWMLAISLSALALEKTSQINGVWSGTIGERKILACFISNDNSDYTNETGYFYLHLAQIIQLRPDPEHPNRWLEGDRTKTTGVWEIKEQNDSITGYWSNLLTDSDSQTLPILLKRFKSLSSDHSTSCDPESSVFNPAAHSEKILIGKKFVLMGNTIGCYPLPTQQSHHSN
jgi:hypothetical protein